MAHSGVPFTKSGVNLGFTDFSEFETTGGVPSGITEYGITPTSPSSRAIEYDSVEGKYFKMANQGFKSWGYAIDGFSGKMLTGELLARVWMDIPVDGRKGIGPAASMAGLIGQSEVGADFDCWSGAFYHPVGADESGGFSTNNGSASNTITAALQEALQDDTWAWIRIRRVPNGGDSAKDDWKITAWFGGLSDEPSSPDGVVAGQVRGQTFVTGEIGWAMAATGAETEQRIAYLAYSDDPTVLPPPVPGVHEHVIRSTIILATNVTTELELNKTISATLQLEGTITEDVEV